MATRPSQVTRRSPAAPGRRGHRAKTLRWALAAIAIGLVAFTLLWPELGPEEGRLQLATGRIDEQIVSNKDTAIDATFKGIDKYGRPFQVTSPHTESSDPERGILSLAMPVADMTLSSGRRVHLTADRGVYDPNAKTVDLWDNVVFIDENGYRVETSEAKVELNEATVSGPNAVTGTASFGEVDGVGFRMTGGGDRVLRLWPGDHAHHVFDASRQMNAPSALRRRRMRSRACTLAVAVGFAASAAGVAGTAFAEAMFAPAAYAQGTAD